MTRDKAACCCAWGASVGGKRYGIPSGEYPEFGCAKCPVHQAALGETEVCRRHAPSGSAAALMNQPESNFRGIRHNLYAGWVAGIAAKHGVPLHPVLDSAGNYTAELQLDLPFGTESIILVVPDPPDDWAP